MHSHVLPRLLVVVVSLVLVVTGLASAPVGAADNTVWSDTDSRVNVLVQDCHGPSHMSGYSPTLAFGFDFEITTSYTVDRDFSVIADYTGIDHPVMERRIVTFAGRVANAASGLSLDYDGHFARTGSYAQRDFTITDLSLHLVPSNEKDVTISVERDSSGVIETPESVLLAYAPRGLHSSLCSYFAGLEVVR
jgi:hypothetical protein